METVEHTSYESIAMIDPFVWNSLVPPGHATGTWEFLKTLEESSLEDVEFLYVVFSQNGSVVACTINCIMTLHLNKMSPLSVRRMIKLLGSLQEFRLIICGNVVADAMSGIFCIDDSVYKLILGKMDSILTSLVREKKLSGIIFKEFDEREKSHLDVLLQSGYTRVLSIPYHFLEIRWGSLGEYAKSLNKKYRQAFKKTRDKMLDNDVTVTITSNPDHINRQIYDLYMYVHKKAQFQIETVTMEFYRQILTNFNGKGNLLLFAKDAEVIGFVVFLDHGHSIQALYLGYDSRLNEKYDIYFNLVFSLLEVAAEQKKEFLNLGQTADSFKSRMGCKWKDKYFYLRLRNPFLQRIISWLSPYIFAYPNVSERNVFKRNNIAEVRS